MRIRTGIPALLIAGLVLSLANPAMAIWWLDPGEGVHIIPDPRPPREPSEPPPPAPTPIPPSPLPPPPGFIAHLKLFIQYAKDIAAMQAWFQSLSEDERQQYATEYQTAQDNLQVLSDLLRDKISDQLDRGLDSNLYILTGVVKQFDAFRARGIFMILVDQVAQKVSSDYLADPQNPSKARRAKDLQNLRAYIGYRS